MFLHDSEDLGDSDGKTESSLVNYRVVNGGSDERSVWGTHIPYVFPMGSRLELLRVFQPSSRYLTNFIEIQWISMNFREVRVSKFGRLIVTDRPRRKSMEELTPGGISWEPSAIQCGHHEDDQGDPTWWEQGWEGRSLCVFPDWGWFFWEYICNHVCHVYVYHVYVYTYTCIYIYI